MGSFQATTVVQAVVSTSACSTLSRPFHRGREYLLSLKQTHSPRHRSVRPHPARPRPPGPSQLLPTGANAASRALHGPAADISIHSDRCRARLARGRSHGVRGHGSSLYCNVSAVRVETRAYKNRLPPHMRDTSVRSNTVIGRWARAAMYLHMQHEVECDFRHSTRSG